VANEQVQPKLAAAIEAGNPPDVMRLYESNVQFYAAGGHLLDVHDIVEKMRREPKGIFESAMASVVYKGRAMGVPLAVNPWPVHARLDLLEQARLEYPKTWDEFIETSKKIQSPPRLYAFGMSLGLAEDTTDNVMNLLWCYGGKMVEADDKTVVMNSPGNLAGVKVIEAMFKTHKIIPPGSISWDNSGNNKAYQSRQAAFVMNPSSIYAYLNGNDQDLQKVTGLFPVPAGPKGTVNQIDTWAYGAFKKNPYPELARGLLDYFMQPANYDRIIQSTGGRWVPVYKRLFESPFWTSKPEFKHFIKMAETGVPVSYAGSPTAAAGEVLNTHVIPKMIQRVLVENWEAARALDECHKKIVEIYTRTAKG
jgi:multiple sugar transport system substrate-binding protein